MSLTERGDLTARIYRQLLDAILDGRLRSGERLPPTRELAQRLDVSRTTVTVAYERLTAEGFLVGQVGAGTFVCAEPLNRTRPRNAPAGSGVRPRRLWQSIAAASGAAPGFGPAPPPIYDFRVGVPDARLFPLETWRRIVARELRPALVHSAIHDAPPGHAGLREAIARYIGISRSVRANADDVLVTQGAQQALDIIGRVLIEPGSCVAVEEPGYHRHGSCSSRWARGSPVSPSTPRDWSSPRSPGTPASSTSPPPTSFRWARRCRSAAAPRCSNGRSGTAPW